MKKFFLKYILDYAFDCILKELQKLANRTDNGLDDDAVRIIRGSRNQILKSIRDKL